MEGKIITNLNTFPLFPSDSIFIFVSFNFFSFCCLLSIPVGQVPPATSSSSSTHFSTLSLPSPPLPSIHNLTHNTYPSIYLSLSLSIYLYLAVYVYTWAASPTHQPTLSRFLLLLLLMSLKTGTQKFVSHMDGDLLQWDQPGAFGSILTEKGTDEVGGCYHYYYYYYYDRDCVLVIMDNVYAGCVCIDISMYTQRRTPMWRPN